MKILQSTAVIATALLSLAACGGGGSSPTPGSGSGGGGVTSTQSFTKAQTRSEVQTALSAFQLASPNSLGALSVARKVMNLRGGRRTLAAPACVLSGTGSATTVDVLNADGSLSETDTVFYDTACKTPQSLTIINVVSVNSTTATGTGTVTLFDRSGNVTAFETLVLTLVASTTSTTITLTAKLAPNASAAPVNQEGTTCTTAAATPSIIACGDATVATSASGGSGVSIGLTQTSAVTAVAETFTSSLYSGTSLGIAQGATPAWTVTGASPFATVAGSLNITLANGAATGGTVSVTDTASGITISGSGTSAGLSLTIKQGATTLATVVLDATGTGTITYADGSTESVVAYVVRGS